MTTYYKATREDGLSFMPPHVDYGAALLSGEVIRHPASKKVRKEPSTYLSVSVEPADCTGFQWPCRLFRVEPVGRVMAGMDYPNKRGVSALRVVEELPAHLALGPNGQQVTAFLARLATLTPEEVRKLAAAWDAAGDSARDAAGDAAWDAGDAARHAAWNAAWDAAGDSARDAARHAARDAALALCARDLITPEQYALLVRPFVDAGLEEWVA